MLTEKNPKSIRCGDRLLNLSSPVIMSILNITDDSFYAPSRIEMSSDKIIEIAGKMLDDGARILDVGGMSSRPGAKEIEPAKELKRVISTIEAIKSNFPDAIISVDTYRAEVALKSIEAGATMVNDISGGSLDPDMIDLISSQNAAYVLMHMRGTPSDMQSHTEYQNVTGDVLKYFVNKLRILHERGIHDIVIDPGFGFSKTIDQNYQLLDQLDVFQILECPLMIGLSRKSSLSQVIGRPVEETLDATTALHMASLQKGASILRVHDVKSAMDAILVFNKLQEAKIHSYNRL